MERVLDPAFFEFGRSGRVYSRRDSLDVPPDSLQATVPLSGFAVHEISDDVALVTYVSEVRYGSEVQRGNRSSLWTRSAGRWRLRFHQGTPLAR